MPVPRPRPSILDQMVKVSQNGASIWRDPSGKRYYTWDSLHEEVEVFSHRGRHLGAVDPINGKVIKQAAKGRRLEL